MSQKQQLQAEEVVVALRSGRLILNQVSLTVQPKEIFALLGANGAGKSTFSAVLAGDNTHIPMRSGQVLLNARALNTYSMKALARQRSVLTQFPSLNFQLSVREVIEMGAYPFPELSDKAVQLVLAQVVDWLDLASFLDRPYQDLSGGEKQRVQFARILLQLLSHLTDDDEARYCLLDEPTSSLDPKNQQALIKVLRKITAQYPVGAFIVLHDVNLAALYCDRLALLAHGQLIAQGTPQEVLTPENLWQTYGLKAQTIAHPFAPGKVLVVWTDETLC